jgi:hypothetical protein
MMSVLKAEVVEESWAVILWWNEEWTESERFGWCELERREAKRHHIYLTPNMPWLIEDVMMLFTKLRTRRKALCHKEIYHYQKHNNIF